MVPYDPDWPQTFESERAVLEKPLAPWLEGGIHHVGSTSVPGLAAKPIIDLLAGVGDPEQARAAFPELGSARIILCAHRPEAQRFGRPGYHLHLTEPGSDLWRERLAFRDALRRDRSFVGSTRRGSVRTPQTRRSTHTRKASGHLSPAFSPGQVSS